MKAKHVLTIVAVSLIFTACQDYEGLSSSTSLSDAQLKSAAVAVSDILIESVAEDANYEAEFYAGYEHLLRQLSQIKGKKNDLMAGKMRGFYVDGRAPIISIDTADAGYPIVITIDYGDSTLTRNGRLISGVVSIEVSAPKNTDGATRTITYKSCSIDSITIDGISVQKFTGDDVTTRQISTNSDATFTLPNGTVIERIGQHQRVWLDGIVTEDRSDDKIEITGNVSIQKSTGDSYMREIVEPLLRLGTCRHYVQGVVDFIKNGELIGTLDFGSGDCDNIASLTTGGETIDIDLKDKMPKANTEKFNKKKGNKRLNSNK